MLLASGSSSPRPFLQRRPNDKRSDQKQATRGSDNSSSDRILRYSFSIQTHRDVVGAHRGCGRGHSGRFTSNTSVGGGLCTHTPPLQVPGARRASESGLSSSWVLERWRVYTLCPNTAQVVGAASWITPITALTAKHLDFTPGRIKTLCQFIVRFATKLACSSLSKFVLVFRIFGFLDRGKGLWICHHGSTYYSLETRLNYQCLFSHGCESRLGL